MKKSQRGGRSNDEECFCEKKQGAVCFWLKIAQKRTLSMLLREIQNKKSKKMLQEYFCQKKSKNHEKTPSHPPPPNHPLKADFEHKKIRYFSAFFHVFSIQQIIKHRNFLIFRKIMIKKKIFSRSILTFLVIFSVFPIKIVMLLQKFCFTKAYTIFIVCLIILIDEKVFFKIMKSLILWSICQASNSKYIPTV